MVQKRNEMIRVAFILPEDERWTGGINYIRNLLFALASVEQCVVEPVLFVSDHLDDAMLQKFQGLARIERSSIFNRNSLVWKIRRAVARITEHDFFCSRLFVRHGIDLASHCNLTARRLPFKSIEWIPDFQHLHLPELFSPAEIRLRNWKYKNWIRHCDLMVLSSEAAFSDYREFAPEYESKTRILHFVSQANPRIYELNDFQNVRGKYNLPEKFFYLPNQLWKHKNHLAVVEAVGKLKQRGLDIHVVCTGYAADLRSSGYGQQLMDKVRELNVEDNIHILGLIDYDDVMALFRHSVSIVNPSFFEGWSSTVEEAKSVGKNIILSDIPVHREQDPPQARYFPPDDVVALADILENRWQSSPGGPDFELEASAHSALPERTRHFGEYYQQLVCEVMGWKIN